MTNQKQAEFFVASILDPETVLDMAIDWIGDQLEPEHVFSQKKLEQWAFDNGFKKFE